jgi:hypothetical protein
LEASGYAAIASVDGAHSASAEIRHISLSGIGLVTDRQFVPGIMVRVETSSWFVFGEIRHSTATDDGRWAAGIIFVTESFDKSASPGEARAA